MVPILNGKDFGVSLNVDCAEFAQVTKFNFLKEMSKLKARVLVGGLPLTTESYERSRNILKSKYGKDNEVEMHTCKV